MAEWLRRLTRNQIPSGSVGSNPTDCDMELFCAEENEGLNFATMFSHVKKFY